MLNETNSKIRDVAFKLFLEKGYEATNIRDICKEVNIKPSSLYFYYKSKEELFINIYDDIWIGKMDYLKSLIVLEKDNTKMKLYYLYKEMISYYSDNIVQQKFLLRYHLFPPRELLESISAKYKTWIFKENKVKFELVTKFLDVDRLGEINPGNYLDEYKRFEYSQLTNMVITNIKMSDKEIDTLWSKFWYCTIQKCK
ncbi:TetR family transcriptional regulator [Alkalibaculum sp. M08DMB]|uniref:TetR family transcriptional regulator n=1 Tax=Alkalibaculum sporogenes TaxID=2655001 RepID=A0A6A7KD88_9FIRM|nr:TetR/AcrR family transcriptional regulator [Alkalibaculum sporogenes]MPW27301.1 TetR family transcriptional regulator [Alkalibaculum sporogenes]